MLKSNWGFVIVVLIMVITASVTSCGKDELLKLSRADNQLIDSLFFAQKDSLIKRTDSICEAQYDNLLSSAMDSIKKLRREEIESILSR